MCISSTSTPPGPPPKKLASSVKPKNRSPVQKGQSTGRWTNQEHEAFLEWLLVYGREWKKVAKHIPTRTCTQVRSHAQKYFAKLTRDEALSIIQQDRERHGVASAAASIADSGILPQSVQKNVKRILANPKDVQQEVETTLKALREKYRQLQQCLEVHNNSSSNNNNSINNNNTYASTTATTTTSALVAPSPPPSPSPSPPPSPTHTASTYYETSGFWNSDGASRKRKRGDTAE